MAAFPGIKMHVVEQPNERFVSAIYNTGGAGDLFSLKKKKKDKDKDNRQANAFPGVRLNVLPTDKEWSQRESLSIFGKPINRNAEVVPVFLRKSCNWLEANALETEGLFRVTASNAEVDGLMALLEKGIDIKQINLDVYKVKPHVVATTLKRYFRDLPEPLLTFDLYYAFIEVRRDNVIEDILELLHKIDIGYLMALRFFIRFLNKVQQLSEVNKMNADNLAIIFSPSLLKAPLELDPDVVLRNCGIANVIVSTLITHYFLIFEDKMRVKFRGLDIDPRKSVRIQPLSLKAPPVMSWKRTVPGAATSETSAPVEIQAKLSSTLSMPALPVSRKLSLIKGIPAETRPTTQSAPALPVVTINEQVLPRNTMVFMSSFISEGDFIELPYL